VLVPGTTEWQYIKPIAGHAIVNLGDAVSIMSAGILRSNMHRVVAPPGAQREHPRYSCVYFGRPEDAVELRNLVESPLVAKAVEDKGEIPASFGTAKDWITRRVKNSRKDNFKVRSFPRILQRGDGRLTELIQGTRLFLFLSRNRAHAHGERCLGC
jgi:2OG-Fe(II) oxygenase superfamily